MRADYAEAYGDLAVRHWWWRARRAWLLERIGRMAPEGGWGRILDVGCGGGLWFDDLAPFGEVEGVEPDASLARGARESGARVHVRPFDPGFRPGRRYGLILFLDVLEHMEDDAGALRHAGRLLEPGGRILVTVPAFHLLWTRHDRLNRHLRRYRRSTLDAAFARAGLAAEEIRYFFHWVFFAKLARRVVEALVEGEPRSPAVPPRPLNELLYRASRVEQKLTARAAPPFGGSLLGIARRPA